MTHLFSQIMAYDVFFREHLVLFHTSPHINVKSPRLLTQPWKEKKKKGKKRKVKTKGPGPNGTRSRCSGGRGWSCCGSRNEGTSGYCTRSHPAEHGSRSSRLSKHYHCSVRPGNCRASNLLPIPKHSHAHRVDQTHCLQSCRQAPYCHQYHHGKMPGSSSYCQWTAALDPQRCRSGIGRLLCCQSDTLSDFPPSPHIPTPLRSAVGSSSPTTPQATQHRQSHRASLHR